MVAKFKILKRFRVLEKKSIFSAKTFEKLNRFYKDYIIFSNNYFTNFSFMEDPLNSEKCQLNSINELRILSKNSKDPLDRGLLVKD